MPYRSSLESPLGASETSVMTVEAGTVLGRYTISSPLGTGGMGEVFRWLRKAAETGFPCYPWFERDPLLASLRKNTGFQQFMNELQKTFEIAKTRYSS